MMIVSENQNSLPVVRRDALPITTGQGFATFMVTEEAAPSEGINPVGPQEPQSVPPDGADAPITGTGADPTGLSVPQPDTAESLVGQGHGRADQDTETENIAFVGRGTVPPTKPLTADRDVLPTAPQAELARDLHGPRMTLVPGGPAATPPVAATPTDPPHAAPSPVPGRGTLTTDRLQARATNAHGHQGTGAGDMPSMQPTSSRPGPLAAPERPSATATEPQGATAKALGTDSVPPDGVRIAARTASMPSALEAAFLIPARPGHRHDALTPPDLRQKASAAIAPVTGSVTLPAQRFGAFVNPAGNRTAEPAADIMSFAEPEADGSLRLGATETASSALRGTVSASAHLAPPQNTSQTTAQIVAAISGASVDGQKTTEVALNPAELGRVRLRLATTDGVLTVLVSAERAETMELLRRNIETLTHDLSETGYDGAQIVFSQDGGRARDKEARAPVTAPTLGAPAANAPDMPPPMLVMLGDRLDIRV
jgi:hypothetical protein